MTDPVLEALRDISDRLDKIEAKLSPRVLIQRGGSVPTPRKVDALPTIGERHLESTDVRRAFDRWLNVMGKNPKTTKLTPERRRAIQARLKEGYTVDRIMRAIDGCANSDFHMARGEHQHGRRFNDLTLICRSGSKIEEFEAMIGQDPEERRRAFL